MNVKALTRHLAGLGLVLGLAACGGGNNEAGVGGNVSGLAAGAAVTIQDNGSDTLTLSNNSVFRFAQTIASGGNYAVTVLTPPAGQVCTVENGSGSINANGDDVNTVNVTCVSVSSVGGSVTGLAAGTSVTLSNGSVLLPVAIDGAFAFPGLLSAGTAYNVSVATQPVGESCTLLNGTGTVSAGVPVVITVNCS